jgi:hypothetical protein
MRRMRWALWLVAASCLGIPSERGVLAISGACKERDYYNQAWRRNDMAFDQCKTYNERRDGDDVFAERGTVWWDVRG